MTGDGYMDIQDRLMASFPQFKFHFRNDMPSFQPGMIYGKDIYIDKTRPRYKQNTIIAEEIGHGLTGVGSIMYYDSIDDYKQEYRARRFGIRYLVSLDRLIEAYQAVYDSQDDIFEYLEISADYFDEVLDYYRSTMGEHFDYGGYKFDLSHGIWMRELN